MSGVTELAGRDELRSSDGDAYLHSTGRHQVTSRDKHKLEWVALLITPLHSTFAVRASSGPAANREHPMCHRLALAECRSCCPQAIRRGVDASRLKLTRTRRVLPYGKYGMNPIRSHSPQVATGRATHAGSIRSHPLSCSRRHPETARPVPAGCSLHWTMHARARA
jgi:hypothetical protein